MKKLHNKLFKNWLIYQMSMLLVLFTGLYAVVPTHSTGLYAVVPTHSHVSYGSESRQWLNIYKASSSVPTPIYIYSHFGGSTADEVGEWANDLKAEGITTISWASILGMSSESDLETIWADAELMLDWVKNNASTYNFDIGNIIIGGRSRGSVGSWKIAHSLDPAIKGIHMGQALPDRTWASPSFFYPPDDVSAGSPPISLSYRMSPGTSDPHDPERGLVIIDRYIELGIGNKAELIHSLGSTSRLYDDLIDFCKSVIGNSVPTPEP